MHVAADVLISRGRDRLPPAGQLRRLAVMALMPAMSLLSLVSPVNAVAQESPTTTAAAADAAAPSRSLAAFLREYRRALVTGDQRYLAEHTVFPFAFEELVYDMEVKTVRRSLASAEALLQVREQLIWPVEFSADTQGLLAWRRGEVDCADPESPDRPDYGKGEAAVELDGARARLSYLVAACDAEAHVSIFTFTHDGDAWRLRERAVRPGAR